MVYDLASRPQNTSQINLCSTVLWSPRFRHHCYMSSSHFFKNSFFTKFYLFSFSARLTNEKCQFILSKKDSLQPLKNMHKLATVSYTVSQCGRKVCFITSLYSQVTRPCFLKEKKSLHQTEDVDEREFLGGFCLPLTKVAHLLLQQILSCSLGEKNQY